MVCIITSINGEININRDRVKKYFVFVHRVEIFARLKYFNTSILILILSYNENCQQTNVVFIWVHAVIWSTVSQNNS